MNTVPVEPRVVWITDPPPPTELTYFSRWGLFLRTGYRPDSSNPAEWSEEAATNLPTDIPRIGTVVGFWVRYGRGCAVRFSREGTPEELSDGIPQPWLSGRHVDANRCGKPVPDR